MVLIAILAACSRGQAPRAASPLTAITTSPPVVATSPTTAPPPTPPFTVATTVLALVDTSRPTVSRGVRVAATRALTTVIWYPAVAGRWPLVLFAPGYNVGPETYTHLCQAWAAAGYVVAAPKFPLSDPEVARGALDERDLDNQPADLLFVMAALVDPASPVTTRIDPARIAATGHSDGAEDALALGQGANPAIKAVIAMSGQPLGQRRPNPPLLAIQGDIDTINPPALSQAVYDQAMDPRFLLTLLGAGHLPPFAGGTKWQPIVEAVTVDFLDLYVAGRPQDQAPMAADGAHPGLSTFR